MVSRAQRRPLPLLLSRNTCFRLPEDAPTPLTLASVPAQQGRAEAGAQSQTSCIIMGCLGLGPKPSLPAGWGTRPRAFSLGSSFG